METGGTSAGGAKLGSGTSGHAVAMGTGSTSGRAVTMATGIAARELRRRLREDPGEVPTRIDPASGLRCRCPPALPPEPRSDWTPPPPPPPPRKGGPRGPIRRLRLLNTLTGQQSTVQSDSVRGPLQGALLWNAHARGYAWRSGGAPLRPEDPLPPPSPEPGTPPESPPTALLYFADDFVEI